MAGELCEDPKSKIMVSSSGGFFYTDVSLTNPDPNQFTNQINGYESNPAEIFNMTTGMEMIGFSKNLFQHDQTTTSHDPSSGEAMWKELFAKASIENQSVGPSSSKDFYQQDHEFNNKNSNKADFTTGISVTSSENQLVGSNWGENRFLVHDDSSLRCVFPCEGDERPSQGLSLSLSSNKPSSIGLQSFQLRQTSSNEQQQLFVCNTSFRDGLFGKLVNVQENQIMRDGFLGKAANIYNNEGQFQIRNSKYLGLAQEILKEFCCLGTKQTADLPNKSKIHKSKQFVEDNGFNSSRKQPTVSSLEFMELQKTKTKLLSLLEEVERRYKHYSDQMRGVVVSFEEVAGSGSAKVYSALASKAMSRHFKCLKDGILRQIQAMEEKDPVVLGTTRGETPRLRAIDQAIRQHRSFQPMSMLETHPWRPQRGLPERSVSVLRAWLFEHFLHPYPSDVDKHILARQTGLSRSQVSNWFINARVRLWKPMVEEMYLEEKKDLEETNNNMASPPDGVNMELNNNNGWHSRNASLNRSEDEKPTPAQLVRIDSECLSSIITNPNKNDISRSRKTLLNHHIMNQQHCGTIDLDFSSYNQLHSAAGSVSYANHDHDHHNSNNNNNHINFNGGGVSLTLGLQQNNINNAGSGVNLAFSPVASKSSLFYPRDHDDHIDECHPVQYSLLDGDQNQNLPYRNLMGAQLLHDLAG